MLLQLYTILYETSICAYVLALRYVYALDKILKFVSVFCFLNLSCSMIVHIFKDKYKVAEDINSLNLLVFS